MQENRKKNIKTWTQLTLDCGETFWVLHGACGGSLSSPRSTDILNSWVAPRLLQNRAKVPRPAKFTELWKGKSLTITQDSFLGLSSTQLSSRAASWSRGEIHQRSSSAQSSGTCTLQNCWNNAGCFHLSFFYICFVFLVFLRIELQTKTKRPRYINNLMSAQAPNVRNPKRAVTCPQSCGPTRKELCVNATKFLECQNPPTKKDRQQNLNWGS